MLLSDHRPFAMSLICDKDIRLSYPYFDYNKPKNLHSEEFT